MLSGLAILVVGLLFALTYAFSVGWWNAADTACGKSNLGCGLVIHFVGTGIVAAAAFYLVFLRREAQAAGWWRSRALKQPEELFTWLPPLGGVTGLAAQDGAPGRALGPRRARQQLASRAPSRESLVEHVISRDKLVTELADDLDEGGRTQVLVGPTGSGKTMVLLKLTQHLAARGQVPVPVSMRDSNDANFEARAREAYRQAFPKRTDEEAEKQWRWLRRGKLITVIADDLDKANSKPHQMVGALQDAARQGLRVVAAGRPSGVPPDYKEGRIELDPLDRDEVFERLLDRYGDRGDVGDAQEVVDRVVRATDMASTPYYYAIAHVLTDVGALRDVELPAPEPRLALLQTYRKALIAGKLRRDAGLDSGTREHVLDGLEAVAYARLMRSKRVEEIGSQLQSIGCELDTAKVVDYAQRLGVLESRYDGVVRFGHPTTYAYFASCFLARHKLERWHALLHDVEFGSVVSLALIFANAAIDDSHIAEQTCEQLLAIRHTLLPNAGQSGDPVKRTLVLKTMTQIARNAGGLPEPVSGPIVDAVVAELDPGGVAYEQVGSPREQTRFVEDLAHVGSENGYLALWAFATRAADYLVRREAITEFLSHGAESIDTALVRIESAIDAAERYCREKPVPTDTDQGELFDDLRAVAMVLPSLRNVCQPGQKRDRLEDYQRRLPDLFRRLTKQRGLEAAIADGLKLDAMLHPASAPDQAALDMLKRADFWFSRVLLLQAVTRRCIEGDDLDGARGIVRAAQQDEHPFVRETARLCVQALDEGRWRRYLWQGLTGVAAGSHRPLSVKTRQLIGEIVLALNMNEHQDDEARIEFAKKSELPHCLRRSEDRREILGLRETTDECPFWHKDGCLCPYRFNPPTSGIRRELSRAFCRDQRIHAKALKHSEIGVSELKEFWLRMEYLARF